MMQTTSHAAVPFYRDVRFLRVLMQVIFILLVLAVGAVLYANLTARLRQLGIGINFGFLNLESAFAIGERPIPYQPSDSYARAFLVGFLNTLRVAVVGIGLATVLGVLAGVARLSGNWLVRQLATAYVEVARNVPLLVQLFAWFFGVFLALPAPKDAPALAGTAFFTNRGMALPWPRTGPGFALWAGITLAALILAVVIYRRLLHLGIERGRYLYPGPVALAVLLAVSAGAWIISGGSPLNLDYPTLQGFGYKGGVFLSTNFSALLLGLTFYTGAYIAEVVRAGILAVPKGQLEAAQALGLRHGQILRFVVFPQALRVIIPPLTNQYLNLAKNSSLALAIGYPDLFSVSSTVFNNTGRAVETVTLVMVSYLAFSLLTSLFMNLYNRSIQFVER